MPAAPGIVYWGLRVGGIGCIALVVMAVIACGVLIFGCAVLLGTGEATHASKVHDANAKQAREDLGDLRQAAESEALDGWPSSATADRSSCQAASVSDEPIVGTSYKYVCVVEGHRLDRKSTTYSVTQDVTCFDDPPHDIDGNCNFDPR